MADRKKYRQTEKRQIDRRTGRQNKHSQKNRIEIRKIDKIEKTDRKTDIQTEKTDTQTEKANIQIDKQTIDRDLEVRICASFNPSGF